MIVNRKELLREWEWANRIVEKKTTVPILTHIALQQRDHILGLAASDLEIFGSTSIQGIPGVQPIDTPNIQPLSIAAPAKLTLDFLKLLKDEQVNLDQSETKLVIRYGENGVATFDGMSLEPFPVPPELPTNLFELRGVDVAFPRASSAITMEESRFTLNGALIECRRPEEGMVLVATDGHRLSWAKLDCADPVPLKRTIVHRDTLIEAARLNGGHVILGVGEDHVSFISNKRSIVGRKCTGKFPDWERVMPSAHALETMNAIAFEGGTLREILERMAHVADPRSLAFRMDITEGRVRFHAWTMERGRASETLPVGYHGPSMEMAYNATYWLDFLSRTEGPVTFRFRSAKDAAALEDETGWRYVVMPMRI